MHCSPTVNVDCLKPFFQRAGPGRHLLPGRCPTWGRKASTRWSCCSTARWCVTSCATWCCGAVTRRRTTSGTKSSNKRARTHTPRGGLVTFRRTCLVSHRSHAAGSKNRPMARHALGVTPPRAKRVGPMMPLGRLRMATREEARLGAEARAYRLGACQGRCLVLAQLFDERVAPGDNAGSQGPGRRAHRAEGPRQRAGRRASSPCPIRSGARCSRAMALTRPVRSGQPTGSARHLHIARRRCEGRGRAPTP
jgi:hypothetical protein